MQIDDDYDDLEEDEVEEVVTPRKSARRRLVFSDEEDSSNEDEQEGSPKRGGRDLNEFDNADSFTFAPDSTAGNTANQRNEFDNGVTFSLTSQRSEVIGDEDSRSYPLFDDNNQLSPDDDNYNVRLSSVIFWWTASFVVR